MEGEEQIKFENAKKRVIKLKKFYRKLFTYILVMIFLAGINYYQNEWKHIWFIWPLFGLGTGIMFRAIKAFEMNLAFNKDWEARKMKEFMEKEESQQIEQWE